MDLALDYLARTTHDQNAAAADRVNEYRRMVAERRALDTMSPEIASAQAAHLWWFRVLRALTPSRSHAHRSALPGRS